MLADEHSVLRSLRLPPESEVDIEPSGPGVERWRICPPGGGPRDVVLRAHPDGELAANHVAVVDTLLRMEFPQMPRPLAVVGEVVIEETLAAVSALALVPPAGSVGAAMRALATLHALDVREGLRWELEPAEILSAGEPPMHRLGFAAHERDAASPWLSRARDAILASPWGFAHGDATAQNVLLAPGRAWLVSFHRAGFGPQVFDVGAFLLTSGLGADERREAAREYATARDFDADVMADVVDLGGILWGVGELLTLPRRSIELFGDDAATSALNTAAVRIERGIREPAGNHAAAAGIRAALWPS